MTELLAQLYQLGAIQFGQFTLKNGQHSSIYLNLRIIISCPSLLTQIGDLMWQRIADKNFDLLCGVPYAALPLATCLSLKHNVPLIMRRKERKNHGTKQIIEGIYAANQRCIIIEDVITTGSSILQTATDLTQAGLMIEDVVAFTDRSDGTSEIANAFNVHVCFTLREILHALLQSNVLSENETAQVHSFLETAS